MEGNLKKITPGESQPVENTQEKPEEGSILLPKISMPQQTSDMKTSGKSPKTQRKLKHKKLIFTLGGVLLVLLLVFGVIGILAYRVYIKGMEVKASSQGLVSAVKAQDLPTIKTETVKVKNNLSELKASYNGVKWMKVLPFVGAYVSDGEHGINAAEFGLEAGEVMLTVIEPYADIIGFTNGHQAESGTETAKDRIDFVVKTIPDVIPKADDLISRVSKVRTELSNIDPERYPEEFKGRKVRSQMKELLDMVDTTAGLIENSKPLLEASPYILGIEKGRNYLVLFQNDKELRPTGGFLTAYSIAKVENGKFEPVSSSDIYHLDDDYTPVIAAPDPMVKYLKGPYVLSRKLRIRDMNWSPDFHDSMKIFLSEAEKAGIGDVDGIIAVDTQTLVNLLDVLGPIGVPGYGNFSTEIIPECNCPQVVYELESFADVEGPIVWSENTGEIVLAPANYDNRKKIIGPLMNSILSNTLGQSKEKIPALFEAGLVSLTEKHVLFYMKDENAQKATEAFGIAGRITDYEGDYLHINDANLGGRKSNMYVKQEVQQDVSIAKDGTVEKTLTITYKNPEKQDGWLNSVLPNWMRVYVPEGSQLISFEGVEEQEKPYEDLGKTVFAGFFKLRPQGVSKVTLKYKLPFKADSKEFKLYIQKQPGTEAPLYLVNLGKQSEEFYLRTDKELTISR